jgi:putative redox protein
MTQSEIEALQTEAMLHPGTVIVANVPGSSFHQNLFTGGHVLDADESHVVGGDDLGPDPFQLLLMALGACTSMTVSAMARHRHWPLERVVVRLTDQQSALAANGGRVNRITRLLDFVGPLTTSQREDLLEAANNCPMHQTLTSPIEILTMLRTRVACEVADAELVDNPASDPPSF